MDLVIDHSAEELVINPTVFSKNTTSVPYTIMDGDTLIRVSQKFYKNSTSWKYIATYNNILDPFTLVTGTNIQIPQ